MVNSMWVSLQHARWISYTHTKVQSGKPSSGAELHHRPNVDRSTVAAHHRRKSPPAGSILHAAAPPSAVRLASFESKHLRDHVANPNVIVAHTRQGVDIVNVFTGDRISQISLPAPRYGGMAGVWADINGDWIIDHVQAIPGLEGDEGDGEDGEDEEGDGHGHSHGASKTLGLNHGRSAHYQLPSCWLQVVSGVPPLETIWNGPLCHTDGRQRDGAPSMPSEESASSANMPYANSGGDISITEAMSQSLLEGRQALDKEDAIRVATPTLVRHPMLTESAQIRAVVPFSIVVLVSNGVLTHYSHKGALLWQTTTSATWHVADAQGRRSTLKGSDRGPDAFVPGTIVADLLVADEFQGEGGFSWNEQEHLLLATGDASVVLARLSSGEIMSSMPIEDPPTGAPVVGDFTNDGANDFVLVTRSAVVGFAVVASPVPNFLFVCSVVLLGTVGFVASLKLVGLLDEDDEDGGVYVYRAGGGYEFQAGRMKVGGEAGQRSRRAMDFNGEVRTFKSD